ncbi:hypothetical protein [Thalassomonas actiniarum]|uniref:Uncharacterized protein n=1 Tax=Thalassomonas actiniarum TaxID=485447 RepID=A0AAF0C088_9GAMM|nr:hypothetical protein [Thalassomonas actiniarum]WDD98271.1 hypothetical protein SG35_023825 [Thalassomonas actiniarum]
MKKALMILTGLAAMAAIAFWLNSTGSDTEAVKSETDTKASITAQVEAPHKQHLAAHQHAHPAQPKVRPTAAPKNNITAIENRDDYPAEPVFTQSETAEKVLKASGKLRENLRGEVYLEVDNGHISSLEVGDTLKLEVPFFDMYYDAEIASTDQDRHGNKTINASFELNDETYNTTLTINDHAIYAHVNTPYGIYTLAGDGQYAWMAESSDLVHGAIPDQIGPGPDDHSDGSDIPQKPIEITGK